MTYLDRTAHISKFGGDIWYVNGGSGNDANSGKRPADAFATIGKGILEAAAGDAISVKAGTYDEAGLDIDKNALELWTEIGTIITDSAGGVPLTISGAYCFVGASSGALRINNNVAAVTGVYVTGVWAYLKEIRVACASTGAIGFDITGDGADLRKCRCSSPLTAAFKIQGDKIKVEDCCTGGELADSSIGFWITNDCDKARIRACSSQGHSTAGYQFDAGCTNVSAIESYSGGGDGTIIDDAENTSLHIADRDGKEYHEHTYPNSDGEGTAGDPITVASEVVDETGADSTANYFGGAYALIPPGTITSEWHFLGLNLFAITASDNQRFFCDRIVNITKATRNGGNNWDEGATVLTVDSADTAALYEVDDLVWITSPSYKPDGEIVKVTDVTGAVITIARNMENSGRTGLHWDHTTNDAGNEEMYLAHRDALEYHKTMFDFAAGSAKDFLNYHWTHPRRMSRNDGLVVRMINGTDTANSQCEVTTVWTD